MNALDTWLANQREMQGPKRPPPPVMVLRRRRPDRGCAPGFILVTALALWGIIYWIFA